MAEVLVLVESNTTGTGRLFAERALARGLQPHLLSQDPARYPYVAQLGLTAHTVDTDSAAEVLKACQALAGDHVLRGVTSSSEYFIGAAARAAHALGLAGEDPHRLEAARDKSHQRACFASSGIASPGFRVVAAAEEAAAAAVDLGLPVVLKPVGRSGSLGVRRCDDLTEVVAHARLLASVTHDERGRPLATHMLVEKYVAGPEFSVEILAGRVRAVVAKIVDESRGFLETGHDVPAPAPEDVREALESTALRALDSLGLSWGAAHVELRLEQGIPTVIEVNPRLAGGMIPRAVQAATGEDLIDDFIALTAGQPMTERVSGAGQAAIRFVVPDQDGVVSQVPTAATVAAVLEASGVLEAVVSAERADVITLAGCFLDRVGYVVATGADADQAGRRAAAAAHALRPLVVPAAGATAQP